MNNEKICINCIKTKMRKSVFRYSATSYKNKPFFLLHFYNLLCIFVMITKLEKTEKRGF